MGIVNGTTNFILDKMHTDGADFADVLAEAQRLGYAEADPTADVEGYDAAAKAAILASLAFHSRVRLSDVSREGITGVTSADIAAAKEMGCVIKLLARCALSEDGTIALGVHPTMVPVSHPLAAIPGAYNAVFIESRHAGRLMFMGPGAGGSPTASAVLGDLVTAARNRVRGTRGPGESTYSARGITPAGTGQLALLRVDDRHGRSGRAGAGGHLLRPPRGVAAGRPPGEPGGGGPIGGDDPPGHGGRDQRDHRRPAQHGRGAAADRRDAGRGRLMDLACLDLEGVLVPEIWIRVAETTGIEELRLTTRDIADYDELMRHRLRILDANGIGLELIQEVIAAMGPMEGAADFLNWLRARFQVVILSDTFYEFAMPLMAQLGHPTLLCHRLRVESDHITGYTLRQPDSKRAAVRAFHHLNYRVVATGDSYNDVAMLAEADAGILFRPPANVVAEFPRFPVVTDYAGLREAFSAALS